MSWIEAAVDVIKFVGKPIAVTADIVGCVTIALLSVAQSLLQLVGLNLAHDVGEWKDAMIGERVAKSDEAKARANKVAAEATLFLASADAKKKDAQTRRIKANRAKARKGRR